MAAHLFQNRLANSSSTFLKGFLFGARAEEGGSRLAFARDEAERGELDPIAPARDRHLEPTARRF